MAITVVPAYGRDYKSKKAVLQDWQAGKDFIIQDMSSPYDGKKINIQDAQAGGVDVMVRYNKLMSILPIKAKPKASKVREDAEIEDIKRRAGIL